MAEDRRHHRESADRIAAIEANGPGLPPVRRIPPLSTRFYYHLV